jgi:hypothetical protein
MTGLGGSLEGADVCKAATSTFAVMVALAVAAPAWADDTLKHAGDAVPGHPGLTYLDLVRQAVPSLAENAAGDAIEGHIKVAPRHLAGKWAEGELSDPVTLTYIEDRRIKVGGRQRMVILADLGPNPDRVQTFELMMLFTDTAKPRLLDMADVGLDRYSGFAEHAVLPIGPGDDAVITYSEHNDADVTMGAYLIASTAGDRLRGVDSFYVTSAKLCGWSSIQSARFTTRPDPGAAFRRINLAVTDAIRRTKDDCGDDKVPRSSTQVFRASYRWDAARRRFVTQSSDLKRLEALEKQGF